GCMAAKFFTGLPLDGPDPECVQGYGEQLLAQRPEDRGHLPKPSGDHSRGPVDLVLTRRRPVSACAESPLAGLDPTPTGKGGTHA
ncbi:mycofactocin radical SAM maturase, partial [Streptomyces sp. NPDC090088]